jgi:hypothetical protein
MSSFSVLIMGRTMIGVHYTYDNMNNPIFNSIGIK